MDSNLSEKIKKIKVMAFDCDGVLTDGHIWWAGEEVGFNRLFHVKDGYGIKVARELGIEVAIISGGDSVGLKKRIENLGLKYFYLGNEDKREAFNSFLKATNVEAHEVLYMGDELFDIPLLKKAGFSATVPDAPAEVRSVVDYVSTTKAGRGAVREVIDLVLNGQGRQPNIADF